jgi:hypothetical protein
MNGGDHSIDGFPPSAYCCISLQPHMAYINQPKLLKPWKEVPQMVWITALETSYSLPTTVFLSRSLCYLPKALVTSDTHDIRMVRQLQGIQRIMLDEEMRQLDKGVNGGINGISSSSLCIT